MDSYDVIIIGAGPAGLNCAEKLSKAGKKILLIEKNAVIGPKVCAGGLTTPDLDYLQVPDEILERKYNEITIRTPLTKNVVGTNEYLICTIDRKNLGQWQLNKLDKNKIKIRTNAKATKIEGNTIVVNDSEKIGFKYLVGADGSNSIVRKHLGLKMDNFGIGIQYVIPEQKYDKIEFFLDSDVFHAWYGWIFPHKNYVSIGCGSNPKIFSIQKLRANFERWLKLKGIDISKGRYEAYPINYDYRGYKFKNIFLAGDAAGLTSGLTGEGIYPALVSGEEIAKSIIDENYISEKMEKIVVAKKTQEKILSIMEKSGNLRKVEFEILALLVKNKFIRNKLAELVFDQKFPNRVQEKQRKIV